MKKSIVICLALSLTACGATGHYPTHSETIIPAPSSVDKPGWNTAFIKCDQLAKQSERSVGNNALGGAAVGAGVGALVASIMGADVGRVAGVSALTGGLGGAGNAYAGNVSEHKRIMIECMRYNGFEVY